MKTRVLVATVLIASSLLVSCGSLFMQGQGERAAIYKLSTRQSPTNPALLVVTVDVDGPAKDAAKAELGAKWREPDTLYIWLSPIQSQSVYSYSTYHALHPILSIPMDGVSTHFEATFDIIANMSSSTSYGYSSSTMWWLNQDTYFSSTNTSENMDGYYLYAADGYNYASGSGQQVTAPDFTNLSFQDKEPRGTGESKVVKFPNASAGETWTKIAIGEGGVTASSLASTVADADVITYTYKSVRNSDNPSLSVSVNGSTSYSFEAAAPVWDSTEFMYKYVFTCTFETDLDNLPPSSVTTGAITIPMKKGNWASINISGRSWYSNSYKFIGAITPISGGFEDFDSGTIFNPPFVYSGYYYDYNDATYKLYSVDGYNWQSGTPSAGDRSAAVEGTEYSPGAYLSTGNALMVRGANAGEYGLYDPNRFDYLDIPVNLSFTGGDLMVSYSVKSDLANGDWVQIKAVLSDGSEFTLSEINQWNSTVSQTMDTTLVDGWKRTSGIYESFPPGVTITKLRFAFNSNAWYQGRGVTIDNVQLSSVN